MYQMVDMEMDDEDKMDLAVPMPDKPNVPEYPWGLRICLTEKELQKLGLDTAEAFVGGMVHGHFMARVTSVSANETTEGQQRRVEMQIEDLCIESEDEENEEADSAEDKPQSGSRRRSLYKD